MKRRKKKLGLGRTTIRQLTANSLQKADGGYGNWGCANHTITSAPTQGHLGCTDATDCTAVCSFSPEDDINGLD